ncbi:MAG: DNA replication and repair protein RecF [Candidatus Saccharimonas sp.]|nr:MAG: DNA replication and repair protein RecF [Candidatus Saccharimonas sp.]
MILKTLRVQNFRTHSDFILEIGEKSTLISGANGSGKTSLLEAIYFALQGTSFRSSDKEILRNDGSSWFRIDLKDSKDSLRTIIFNDAVQKSKKQFLVDGNKKARLGANLRIPVVLFEPDDLQLLSGSPTRRRNFLDYFLSQIFPSFQLALARYNKALKQRNNLLKRDNVSKDELFPWNLMLAEYGAEIISKRQDFLELLNSKIEEVYFEISGVKDEIKIDYLGEKVSKNEILAILSENIERDKILGYTNFGPHKHDIQFIFNKKPAQNVASRGENRSLVLALKFIETDILADLTSKRPIVLLDDVFSELDDDRQKLLTKHFSKYQTIITSTNEIKVEDCKITSLE